VEQEDYAIGLVNTSGRDLLENLIEKWIGFIWLRLRTSVQTAVSCLEVA
jgi:hypothetical protein